MIFPISIISHTFNLHFLRIYVILECNFAQFFFIAQICLTFRFPYFVISRGSRFTFTNYQNVIISFFAKFKIKSPAVRAKFLLEYRIAVVARSKAQAYAKSRA